MEITGNGAEAAAVKETTEIIVTKNDTSMNYAQARHLLRCPTLLPCPELHLRLPDPPTPNTFRKHPFAAHCFRRRQRMRLTPQLGLNNTPTRRLSSLWLFKKLDR